MRIHPYRVALSLLLAAAILVAAPLVRAQTPPSAVDAAVPGEAERPRPSNKWRITFDERAKSDGTVSFRVWPRDGAPLQVDVPVVEGQSENRIAASARDALRVALGKGFHVEIDDGEDVLVKARHGTPDFGVQLVGNTARDVDVKLRRE